MASLLRRSLLRLSAVNASVASPLPQRLRRGISISAQNKVLDDAPIEGQLEYLSKVQSHGLVCNSPTASYEVDFQYEQIVNRALQGNSSKLTEKHPAWRAFLEFRRHGRPNIWTYTNLLQRCRTENNAEVLQHIIDMMDADSVPHNASSINCLLEFYLGRGLSLQSVLETASEQNVSLNRESYLLRMEECVRLGLVERSISIFDEVCSGYLILEPNDAIFRAMVRSAETSGDISANIDLIKKAVAKHGLQDYVDRSAVGLSKW